MLVDMDKWFVLAILLLLISWACPSRMQKLCVFPPPPPISFIKLAGIIAETFFQLEEEEVRARAASASWRKGTKSR